MKGQVDCLLVWLIMRLVRLIMKGQRLGEFGWVILRRTSEFKVGILNRMRGGAAAPAPLRSLRGRPAAEFNQPN